MSWSSCWLRCGDQDKTKIVNQYGADYPVSWSMVTRLFHELLVLFVGYCQVIGLLRQIATS